MARNNIVSETSDGRWIVTFYPCRHFMDVTVSVYDIRYSQRKLLDFMWSLECQECEDEFRNMERILNEQSK